MATLAGPAPVVSTVWVLGDGDQARGFLLTAIVFGVLATIVFWISFAAAREDENVVEEKAPTVGEIGRMLRANSAFWLVSGLLLMGSMAGTFFGKSIPYFFTYGRLVQVIARRRKRGLRPPAGL